MSDIVPPLANISPAVAAEMAEQPLIPLDVSGARQFFLSWRHGRLEARFHHADMRTLPHLPREHGQHASGPFFQTTGSCKQLQNRSLYRLRVSCAGSRDAPSTSRWTPAGAGTTVQEQVLELQSRNPRPPGTGRPARGMSWKLRSTQRGHSVRCVDETWCVSAVARGLFCAPAQGEHHCGCTHAEQAPDEGIGRRHGQLRQLVVACRRR